MVSFGLTRSDICASISTSLLSTLRMILMRRSEPRSVSPPATEIAWRTVMPGCSTKLPGVLDKAHHVELLGGRHENRVAVLQNDVGLQLTLAELLAVDAQDFRAARIARRHRRAGHDPDQAFLVARHDDVLRRVRRKRTGLRDHLEQRRLPFDRVLRRVAHFADHVDGAAAIARDRHRDLRVLDPVRVETLAERVLDLRDRLARRPARAAGTGT